MEIKKISIVGLGAMGTMYADLITKNMGKEAVRIVADSKRIARYAEEGIYCNGNKCDFIYIDEAVSDDPADLLLFSVKYGGLENAIKSVKKQVGEHTIILSVLNGVTSEKVLAEAFGKEKVLLCTAQGMDALKEKNTVYYQKMGNIVFGEEDGHISENVKAVSRLFDSMGLPYEIADDMPKRLWAKLMLNTGINQSVTVFETDFGGVQILGKPRDVMIDAMREVVTVANAEGIALNENDVQSWLTLVASLNPKGKPSMRQDAEAHRYSEVDLFAGTIIKFGQKHGIHTPVNQFLYSKIKEMESNYQEGK